MSGVNEFSNRIYQEVARKPGNVLVCPLSLHVVLTLAHQGAVGKTAEEIAELLALSGTNEQIKESYHGILLDLQDKHLKIATKLYPAFNFEIEEDYVADAQNYFFSGVEKINFADPGNAANTINKFVEQKTNNNIRNLVDPSDFKPLTKLVIVNAVHFQASWRHPFTKSFEGDFLVDEKARVKTTMMRMVPTYLDFKDDPTLNARVVRLPHGNGAYSMFIVLPNKQDGISELEAKLTNTTLQNVLEGMRWTEVEVTMPRFTVNTKLQLAPVLHQMGVTNMFIPGKADFTNISKTRGLFVSQVVQETYINVFETGTEASAATAMRLMDASGGPQSPPLRFIANRPFLFFILHEKKEIILFSGRLSNPKM